MSDIDIKFNCDVQSATRSFTQIKTAAAESLNMMRIDLGKFSKYSEQEAVKRVADEQKLLKQKEGMYKLHYSTLSREEKQAYQEAIRHQKMVLDQAKIVANEEVSIYKEKLSKMNVEAKRFADAQKNIMKAMSNELSGIMGSIRSTLSFGGIAGIAGFMGSTLGEDRTFSKHIRSIRAISDNKDRELDLRKELTSTSSITGVNKNDLAQSVRLYKQGGGALTPGMIQELGTQQMLNPDMDMKSYAEASGKLRGVGLSESEQIALMRGLQIQTRSAGADFTAEQVAKPAIETAKFGLGFGVGTNKSLSENIASTAGAMQILSGVMSADESATGMQHTFEFAKKHNIDVGTGNTQDSLLKILEYTKTVGGGDVARGAQNLHMDERSLKLLVEFSESIKTADSALKENIDLQSAKNQIDRESKEQQAETWQSIDKSFNEIKNTVATALAPALKSFAETLSSHKGEIEGFFTYIGKLAEWAAKNPFEALLLLNLDKLAGFVNLINKIPGFGGVGSGTLLGGYVGYQLGNSLQEPSDKIDEKVFGHRILPKNAGAVMTAGVGMSLMGSPYALAATAIATGLYGGNAIGNALMGTEIDLTDTSRINNILSGDGAIADSDKDFRRGSTVLEAALPFFAQTVDILKQLNNKTPHPETKKPDNKGGSAHFSGTHAFTGQTTFGQVIILHSEDRSGIH